MSVVATIDLHFHSIFSDGSFTPETLMEQASRAQLAAVSLTDHDSIQGLDRAAAAAKAHGVRIIPGIEFSAQIAGKTVHILGYFFDPTDKRLNHILGTMETARCNRIRAIVERLQSLGVKLTLDDVLDQCAVGSWGRPHIAKAMVQKGLVRNSEEAFRLFLRDGGPAYVAREDVSAEQVIDIVHGAGGVAVLAHPCAYRMMDGSRYDYLRGLFDHLGRLGLDGIEVAYSNCKESDSRWLRREAAKRDLDFSGGSDYHGTITPRVRLGRGRGNLRVPLDWLDTLEARAASRWHKPSQSMHRMSS